MTHRIVQLTDCHLFSDPAKTLRDIATWPRFTEVLEKVRRQVPDVDQLVLTGDTAHDEDLATYDAVRKELADWEGRVRIIPGNHDNRAALRTVFPDASCGPIDLVTFQVSWDDWQIIGLDSQQPGELPGSLGKEQLTWLRNLLQSAPERHTLLFLHHPPITVQSPWLDRIRLLDSTDLERLVSDHPQVVLIGCGHVHQEVVGSLGRATVLTTPSVGHPFRPRTEHIEIDSVGPAYRLWELFPDGRWSTQVMYCM